MVSEGLVTPAICLKSDTKVPYRLPCFLRSNWWSLNLIFSFSSSRHASEYKRCDGPAVGLEVSNPAFFYQHTGISVCCSHWAVTQIWRGEAVLNSLFYSLVIPDLTLLSMNNMNLGPGSACSAGPNWALFWFGVVGGPKDAGGLGDEMTPQGHLISSGEGDTHLL